MLLNDDECLAFLDTLYILRRTGSMQQRDKLGWYYGILRCSSTKYNKGKMVVSQLCNYPYCTVHTYMNTNIRCEREKERFVAFDDIIPVFCIKLLLRGVVTNVIFSI